MVKRVLYPFFSLISSLIIFGNVTGVAHADLNSDLNFSQIPSCAVSYNTLLTSVNKNIPAVTPQTVLQTPKELAGIAEPSTPTLDSPTDTPTPTPEIREAIISAESISASPATSSAISPLPTTSSGGTSLNADYIFTSINHYRMAAGLPVFQKSDRICQVAQSRAPELYNEIMVNYDMHAGFYARHLPYQATENIIYMKTEDEAVNWWLHSPIHRAAIFGNYTYSCVACSGQACSEIFANY